MARYVNKVSGSSSAKVALFGNSTSVDIKNIKGKPGDISIIPITISNNLNGKLLY